MKNILAVDIGGTNIKYALWKDKLAKVREVKTPREGLEELLETVEGLVSESRADALALSMPGFIDTERGIALTGGALDYISDLKVVEVLEKRLKIPVSVENDAKAAALAELRAGALKNVKNAVMLILGTGVGGAVIIDRKILRGENLIAGEFSFVSADIGEPDNVYSEIGPLLGTAGLIDCVYKTTGKRFKNGREIFKVLEESKPVMSGFREYCSRIAWFIYNLEFIINPECFLIGGGISNQPVLLETIKEEIKKASNKGFKKTLPEPKVRNCHFKSNANLIGAVYHFLDTESV